VTTQKARSKPEKNIRKNAMMKLDSSLAQAKRYISILVASIFMLLIQKQENSNTSRTCHQKNKIPNFKQLDTKRGHAAE
jgi:hypothetical protein